MTQKQRDSRAENTSPAAAAAVAASWDRMRKWRRRK